MMKKFLALMCCATLAMAAAAQDESDISKFSAGIEGGIGYMATTGSLHHNFNGAVNFSLGLLADYNDLRAKFDVDYGQPGFNNPNFFNIKDEQGRDAQINSDANASQLGLSLQVGYKVIKAGRFTITPNFGVRYNRYSWKSNDIEWKKDEQEKEYFVITNTFGTKMSRFSWIASIDIDFKVHERNTTDPFFLNNRFSRLTTYIRLTPWISAGKLTTTDPAVSGLYVGATLRVAGFCRSLGF